MKIGLFFGSFNPIHYGHLLIASQVMESAHLKQVWFVVSPQNPLKKKETLLSPYDRLHLVNLAIEDDTRFRASKVEFSLPHPSYTIDTLTYLTEKHPTHQFYLIMGADNINSLAKWKNYDQILSSYHILVYVRPNHEINAVWANHPSITIFNFPQIDLSATYIRACVGQGKSIKYLVPDPVRVYIETNHLYSKTS